MAFGEHGGEFVGVAVFVGRDRRPACVYIGRMSQNRASAAVPPCPRASARSGRPFVRSHPREVC